ncbi:MAG: SelB C-terminal domain-containing protein, partial [Pseudomonadota bacterium]
DALQLGKAVVVDQTICRRPNHQPRAATASLQPVAARIFELYQNTGLGPPRVSELPTLLSIDMNKIQESLRLLLTENKLVRVSDLYFSRNHVDSLETELRVFLLENGKITPTQFKNLVGQSRKFTIPLAEYFDAQKITLRVNNFRKLRG